jgi:hypothetical protein
MSLRDAIGAMPHYRKRCHQRRRLQSLAARLDRRLDLLSALLALVHCLRHTVLLFGSSCRRYARQAPPISNLDASRIQKRRSCDITRL